MIELLIYSPSACSKLSYVLKFLIQEQLGLSYRLTTDIVSFASSSQPKLNYSNEFLENAIWVKNDSYFSNFGLSSIPDLELSLGFSKGNSTQFDLFAAVFYLLARVEEYQDVERDSHDRYCSKNSILALKGLLHLPLVDLWLQELKGAIETRTRISTVRERCYSLSSTIDVDHIYAYKKKSIPVSIGSTIKDLFRFRWKRIWDRLSVHDPYDRFVDIIDWHKSLGIAPLFFVLTAFRSKYDKSLPPNNKFFVEKVNILIEKCEIGIHPSYQSNNKIDTVRSEKKTLEDLIGQPIDKSRQHFLKLRFPDTYRGLIATGIKADYTMGYPDVLGFRAGTSLPFYWYDLLDNRETELRLWPFQVMDVTLKKYLKLEKHEAIASVKQIVESIRSVDGHCCIIWHNSSFYAEEGWGEWEQVYKEILAFASS